MVEPTSPRAHTPTWWILHAGPWVAVTAAIAYGVAHGATAEFYRPLGLTPEQAGIGTARTVVQASTLLGLLGVLVVSLGATTVVAEKVAGAASRRAGAAAPALVALGPLALLGAEAWAVDRSGAWAWASAVTLAGTAALWVVAVRDPGGSRGRTLGAATAGAATIGLTAAAAWAWPTTATAFVASAFVVLAAMAVLVGDAPEWSRARRYLPPLLLLATLAVAAALSQGSVAVWVVLALPFAAVGTWLGVTRGAGRDYLARGAHRAKAADIPRLDRLIVVLALTAAGAAGTAAMWAAANHDGRHLLATGEARGVFAGQVFPARVMLRYDGVDPMGICRSRRIATLVGGDDRVAYVLLRQERADRPAPDLPLVVGLPFDSYVVTTGVAAPGRCVNLR